MSPYYSNRGAGGRGGSLKGRLAIAGVVVVLSLLGYFSSASVNPVTGEKQYVGMSIDQEIALGLQAAPEMAQQFGGKSGDPQALAKVASVGRRLLERNRTSSPYTFDFHLLADTKTVNAFALPGGQIFITEALYRLLETEGQLAAVLGHEIGHVLERHSAQQLAKAQLSQGISTATVIAAYDPQRPETRYSAQVAALIGQLVTMRFGREDELESDRWGVKLTSGGGYDPRAEIRVMEILAEAGGRGSAPEFFSTHPNPENRIERIKSAIAELFPQGVPPALEP